MKQIRVLQKALLLAGKVLRDNPPADIGSYDFDMLTVLAGGAERDPEGREWAAYFVKKH